MTRFPQIGGASYENTATQSAGNLSSCRSFFGIKLHGSIRSRGDFGIGADLSFLKQAEDEGTQFKDNGKAKPGLQIFRDHGYSWIRLRVLVEPTRMKQDRKYTIAMAQDAKKLGFKIHLDFMYSTAWADPTGQPTPRIWQDMTHAQRSQAVFEFTGATPSPPIATPAFCPIWFRSVTKSPTACSGPTVKPPIGTALSTISIPESTASMPAAVITIAPRS